MMSERPHVIFVGPMKSGTTWTHEYLSMRGDVCLPFRTKEVFFFDRYFHRKDAWYRDQFRPTDAHSIIADLSPSLFTNPDAPKRIRSVLPDARIIVQRRDPVMRSWSHYLHLKRYGYTDDPIDIALDTCPEILEASRHDKWVEHWTSVFGKERVTDIPMADLRKSPNEFAAKIDHALGLPRSDIDASTIGRKNGAALPRHYLISRTARQVSYLLRDLRLDPVVAFARSLGLNRAIYARSGQPSATQIKAADAGLIRERLGLYE